MGRNVAAINGWLHIPSTWSAEVMARQGWDSLTIDMQHGLMGMETAIQMLQAVSTTDVVPMARVNWNSPGDIMKLLDAGAYGIVCPMIETREECEAFVGACRFRLWDTAASVRRGRASTPARITPSAPTTPSSRWR